MGRKAQLVVGPAGSGKSTYCSTLVQHLEAANRKVKVLNLDPAAEHFDYDATADIRDLVTLADVAEELHYGPNGGLVYCMEYLAENLDWLDDTLALDEVADPDDYWIIDCPGQIELYTHFPIMRTVVQHLTRKGFTMCAVYCVEATFISDAFKFFSGCLTAMSAMIQLEIPHVNVLTKMDLLKGNVSESRLERFLWPDASLMSEWAEGEGKWASPKWKGLNHAVTQLIDSYSMVSYLPLDITDEDSIDAVLLQIDHAVQYGEDLEPTEIEDKEDYDE
ncbi:GPN-loop GTPase [Catenaria anguillulae PL171]|uniref:GPN-loop GTPase 3 n=1 Tax=Catenaria anguillulae PL171 TaxID=765915 RepID=A0A1Y2HWY2_9FUNG|nr:GPN-loop GTPase [Catenaria anguillulae PL171]